MSLRLQPNSWNVSTLVSKDADFVELITRHGAPPRLLWVTCEAVEDAEDAAAYAAAIATDDG